MSDDTDRTLNQLEGLTARPPHLSPQGELARDLRNVPLNTLTPRDLRVLIAEHQGLAQVVPLALDLLAVDPELTAERFSGDLLAAVERLPTGFWLTHPALRVRIERIQAKLMAD